jgi:hypothetical protein
MYICDISAIRKCLSVNFMNRSLMGAGKRAGTKRFCMQDHCENLELHRIATCSFQSIGTL